MRSSGLRFWQYKSFWALLAVLVGLSACQKVNITGVDDDGNGGGQNNPPPPPPDTVVVKTPQVRSLTVDQTPVHMYPGDTVYRVVTVVADSGADKRIACSSEGGSYVRALTDSVNSRCMLIGVAPTPNSGLSYVYVNVETRGVHEFPTGACDRLKAAIAVYVRPKGSSLRADYYLPPLANACS